MFPEEESGYRFRFGPHQQEHRTRVRKIVPEQSKICRIEIQARAEVAAGETDRNNIDIFLSSPPHDRALKRLGIVRGQRELRSVAMRNAYCGAVLDGDNLLIR